MNPEPLSVLSVVVGLANTIALAFIAYMNAKSKQKVDSATAASESAEAEDLRRETDRKRLEVYDTTLQKLLERDKQLILMNAEIASLQAAVKRLEEERATYFNELNAERVLRKAAENERDQLEREVHLLTAKVNDLETRVAALTKD